MFLQNCVSLSVKNHTQGLLLFVNSEYIRQEYLEKLVWMEEKFPREYRKARWDAMELTPMTARIKNARKKAARES